MTTIVLEMPANGTPEDIDAFYAACSEMQDETMKYIEQLAAELNIGLSCAADVYYLRTRSRHTPELEQQLIHLYAIGTPPNVNEFGCI